MPRSLPPPAPARRGGPRAVPDAAVAVGYCRRSTDRQEQSIPDQKKVIEAYCVEHGLKLLRWYIDDAISGTGTSNRPGFLQLIADAQRGGRRGGGGGSGGGGGGEFGVIVVYDVKRFGRTGNDEAGYYRHLLRTCGVEVIYATEGFNGGETDDLLRPVKQWQARQESKDLSKVTIRGLLSKAETGAWMGGVPPHGYDLRYENERGEFLFVLRHMPDGSKQMLDKKGKLVRTLARGESIQISKRDRAKLVVGESERVKTVRRLFAMYVDEARGLKAIADALNRSGTATPRGPAWSHIYGGQWRDSTVRAILVNPLYTGDMVWNRRTDARFHMIVTGERGEGLAVERPHAYGARLVPNAESDWIVVRDTHPPLVSRAVFEKASAARLAKPVCSSQLGVAKQPSGGWTGSRARFLLSGLCRCALCGHRYQGVTRQKGKPKLDGTKVRTFSYACGGYIAKGTTVCQYHPVGQEILESAVIEAVKKHYAPFIGPGGAEKLARAVQQALGIENAEVAEARRRNESECRRVEATVAKLLDHVDTIPKDELGQRLAELREERKRLDARHQELDRLVVQQAQVQQTAAELARFMKGLGFVLEHGLPDERIAALRRCVSGIEIDKQAGKATLQLRPLPVPNLAGTVEAAVGLTLN